MVGWDDCNKVYLDHFITEMVSTEMLGKWRSFNKLLHKTFDSIKIIVLYTWRVFSTFFWPELDLINIFLV